MITLSSSSRLGVYIRGASFFSFFAFTMAEIARLISALLEAKTISWRCRGMFLSITKNLCEHYQFINDSQIFQDRKRFYTNFSRQTWILSALLNTQQANFFLSAAHIVADLLLQHLRINLEASLIHFDNSSRKQTGPLPYRSAQQGTSYLRSMKAFIGLIDTNGVYFRCNIEAF